MKRILVPVDFSPSSRAAFAHAVDLARGAQAEVHVLHVYEPSAYAGPEPLVLVPVNLTERWERTRAQIRRELLAFLVPADAATPLVVEMGNAADAIPAVARTGDFDLVVMGAHGGAGLSRIVGKVAEAVMRKAHCQVVMVHLPDRVPRETVPL